MPSQDYNEDFIVPFRNYVLDDLELNTLIDNRFYAAQLATLDLTSTSFPIAVFFPVGGSHANLSIIKRINMSIRCYSNISFDEARDIHRIISERLGGQNGPITIPDTKIIVRPETMPTELYENDPRLFSVGSRFLIHWIS